MHAALIIFDDDDPAVSVLGVSWPDYRVRSAIRAGAAHIVVVAGRITPEIVTAIDRAKTAGVSAVLARTAIEVADLFHPEESVLLLSGPAIVEDDRLMQLMTADHATVLCVTSDSDPAWELIDARARWTGLARIDGEVVRTTATTIGDWDLASTLLRQVIARGRRIVLDEAQMPGRAERAEDLALASSRAIAQSAGTGKGWATRWIVRPVVRSIAGVVPDRLATVARFSPWIAAPPLAAAVVLAALKLPLAAAAALFLGIVVDAFGLLAERATGLWPRLMPLRERLINGVAAAALVMVVLPPLTDRAPIVLAVMLIVMTILTVRLQVGSDDPAWLADVPGYALVIGFAAAFGPVGMATGLVIAVAHAIASLAWLQNRLSRPLT